MHCALEGAFGDESGWACCCRDEPDGLNVTKFVLRVLGKELPGLLVVVGARRAAGRRTPSVETFYTTLRHLSWAAPTVRCRRGGSAVDTQRENWRLLVQMYCRAK